MLVEPITMTGQKLENYQGKDDEAHAEHHPEVAPDRLITNVVERLTRIVHNG
jgi:hypothetical protein